MAKAKTETKQEERIYVIPLLKEWSKVPRYKRSKKAIKAIREFLVRHMKIRDRDLNKIRIDKFVNEEVWFRGIKKPPKKIKIKAIKEGDIVRVYLVDFKDKLKFKKAREERGSKTAEEKKKEKTEDEIKEEKEKARAGSEAGAKIAERQAKQMKHQTQQQKGPKHQQRKALAK